MLHHADIEPRARMLAEKVFTRLGEAEAAVHGVPVDQIHFHEVGAVDSIVDIVGNCILLTELAPDRVVCSPLSVGSGTVKCAHGVMPVPAPATARLLSAAGAPVAPGAAKGELLTPTGAALLTSIADAYGAMPPMVMQAVGYGYGKRDTGTLNCLRVTLGEEGEQAPDAVVQLEANLDDMTAEAVAYLMEQLMEQGALDAWTTPIVMKKGRPAVTASVLCRPGDQNRLRKLMFQESTTLGVRAHELTRVTLERHIETVDTEYGPLRVKVAPGHAAPEYEDCQCAARQHGVPLGAVYRAAMKALDDK